MLICVVASLIGLVELPNVCEALSSPKNGGNAKNLLELGIDEILAELLSVSITTNSM